jgi:DNA polymerase III sliding clamp (beta) subunit (PCNA family)
MDKLTSKSPVRPELASVYFCPDKMVATDSFRLIEVKKEIDIPAPRVLKAKGFRGRGSVSVSEANVINDDGKLIQGELVEADYPDYETVFKGLGGQPRLTMHVNAKYLAELLTEIDAQAGDQWHKVRLDFFDTVKALLITSQGPNENVSVRGLLSPMNG